MFSRKCLDLKNLQQPKTFNQLDLTLQVCLQNVVVNSVMDA